MFPRPYFFISISLDQGAVLEIVAPQSHVNLYTDLILSSHISEKLSTQKCRTISQSITLGDDGCIQEGEAEKWLSNAQLRWPE